MSESPQQYFLTQAGAWLDLYGHSWRVNSHILAIAHKAKKLPDTSLDLIKHLALYTGWLWKHYPMIFTPQAPDLVTPPDNISDLEGTQYDKAILETLIGRCARPPRWADTNLGIGWYMTDVEFLDAPAITDDMLIKSIAIYSEHLCYETDREDIPAILNILLSVAWELYLREWEQDSH